MYKAILFDFDGTLFDTWPAICSALAFTSEHFKVGDVKESGVPKEYATLNRVALMTKVFGRTPKQSEIDYFIKAYTELMIDNTVAFPNVMETINDIAKRNIKWGIVTNKPKQYIQIFIQELTYLQTCSIVLCPEDVNNTKPHPEPLLLACRQLGVDVENSLFVGDSWNDMQAAENCSMDFALVEYGYIESNLKLNYKYALKNIAELIDIIDFKRDGYNRPLS